MDQANTLCQTDLEKVFYVHEWLVQNIAYDREHLSDDVQDDHNLRGALLDGTAVCDGYAKTYALTLRKLGITGVLVTSKDIGHAWNMVELDGNWYQVDCTWDDPVDGSDQLGYCMHKHLLCTTKEMNTNHNDDGDDSVAFDLENLGTQNIVNLATDDTYENTWWKDKRSAIFPCGGDWYYASGERLFWRDDWATVIPTWRVKMIRVWLPAVLRWTERCWSPRTDKRASRAAGSNNMNWIRPAMK